ncbi:MAG: hypothetical protein WAQ53_01285 [Thiofilum sp.]|uniref:hypothetical protein n=1 Tax=Thiofilum sp. TaxID=2212733 RepID=UPI0025D944C8|nr:hypothetical protein [Thiofilum sp.]MBK8455484.1 hypothetical protein [Thiofilum sp.]
MVNSSIAAHLQDLIKRELERGERIQWSDQPRPSFITSESLGSFLFGIPWTAFAVFWVGMAYLGVSEADEVGLFNLFPLFGVPFILIGLAMLSSPLRVYLKLRKTVYALTNKRLILIEPSWRANTIRSYYFVELQASEIYREERTDGSGHLIVNLRPEEVLSKMKTKKIILTRIPQVKEVEQQLKQLVAKASEKEEGKEQSLTEAKIY